MASGSCLGASYIVVGFLTALAQGAPRLHAMVLISKRDAFFCYVLLLFLAMYKFAMAAANSENYSSFGATLSRQVRLDEHPPELCARAGRQRMDGHPFSSAGRAEGATVDPASRAQNLSPRSSAAFEALLRSDWLSGLLVFFVYSILSLIVFGGSITGEFSSYFVGRGSHDPSLFMWFLKWWPYELRGHLNPFVTDLVWSPVGFNVTWTTPIPLAGVLLAPLTKAIGLVATYNLLMLSAPALAAIAAYALCRRVAGGFWPAVFGGYVFGFSPYVLCQIQAHAHLVLVFPIPLSAWLAVRWYQNSLRSHSFVVLYALTMIAEFLLSVEMFALTAIVTALALALAALVGDEPLRGKAFRLMLGTAAAWGITIAAVSPYVYYMLDYAQPVWPIWPAYKFSIDLLNFVVPTEVNLVGANRWLSTISSRFTGNPIEQDGYLAFPLIAIVIGWSIRNWRNRQCKPFILLLASIAIATLGPLLQIGGRFVLPMPWLVIQQLPILEHALPARLMVFAFLIVAVITALWFSDSATSLPLKAIVAAIVVVLTLPNLSQGFWTTRVDTPQFFSDGSYARYLSPRDVVLTLPWGDQGMSMLWQAGCGMCFRNVAGWTGLSRFEVRRWPIVNYFIGDQDVPRARAAVEGLSGADGCECDLNRGRESAVGRFERAGLPIEFVPHQSWRGFLVSGGRRRVRGLPRS